MAIPEDIRHKEELLLINRRNLQLYLRQEAVIGSAFAPPSIVHGIRESREQINTIKKILRDWGVIVEDMPDDTFTPERLEKKVELNQQVNLSGNQALFGDNANHGNVNISGGTIHGSVVGINSGTIIHNNYTQKSEEKEYLITIENVSDIMKTSLDFARNNENSDLIDDINSILLTLQSAIKSHNDIKFERRNIKIRDAVADIKSLFTTYSERQTEHRDAFIQLEKLLN